MRNRDKLLQYQREYDIANKEKVAEQKHKNYLRNRDKLLQYQREYEGANKEQRKARKQKSEHHIKTNQL